MTKKTALEKLSQEKELKKVLLEKNFAGVKAGQRMLVGTPKMIAEYITAIPYGETRSIPDLRADLSAAHQCDAMCPVSTAIFIRIAAEASIEQLDAGNSVTSVIPYWRLLTPDDKITKKLAVDAKWVGHQRTMESGEADG